MDKLLPGPTCVWRARASKRAVSAPWLNTHQTLAPRHILQGKRTGQRRGLAPSQEGTLPQAQSSGLPVEAGLTALRSFTEPFFPFLKWEDHCKGTQATMEHSFTGRCSYPHRHTHRRAARLRKEERQGWGTTHKREHYRSCEDPLKALLGLLRGGQPDLRGSSCLEVKPLLVLVPGSSGGTAHQASSPGSR